ncbi:MAG: DUF2842 domain-containing protein [Devosia sp.]|uniref:DUF2842 domain-containing protein n=2 Tax=Devosia TaxID=46913 RepID=UPI001AD5913F|nr:MULTISPECIES: DUF2842 domain-containing protein [unclassified Devosia]MBN9306375.1 DUF2842 domain-containing protein [Devosia sp.]
MAPPIAAAARRPEGADARMQQKTRKLWGTVAIIVLLIVYPLAIMQIYVTTMMDLPWWGAILVLCIAGLLWFYPASWVVRWMSKPD